MPAQLSASIVADMIGMRWTLFFWAFALTPLLWAQEIEPPAPDLVVEEIEEEEFDATEGSIFTQRNARTMTLSIPAPRGLILDRNGYPLAQTKVAYQLALDFSQAGKEATPENVLLWVKAKIAEANALVGGEFRISDRRIVNYYNQRRWIPRIISKSFDEDQAKKFEGNLPEAISLMPIYLRHYPEKSIAAHLIGYVGTKTRLPDGPINDGDPLFNSVEGRGGFENVFNDELTGEPGVKKMIFDDDSKMVLEEWVSRPRAGGTVVTTLDLKWQRHAENVLRRGCKRGAMVVIDTSSGEVLVMASRPTFNLNAFIPGISQVEYDKLLNDPSKPLFGRAFQAQYPPASTFKPVVGLAAITSGAIRADQKINTPDKIKIGNIDFKNHSRGDLGFIDVKLALAKSANPWFYQVGMKTGPQTFLSAARRLGFGSKTGLPLYGERAGLVPTPEDILKSQGRTTTDGDTANLSIGQGLLLATPLQVAQSMAGIANGSSLMELQLVKQIQDFHGRVVEAPDPKIRNDLSFDYDAVAAVHEGMMQVVHAKFGTGKNASLGFTIMCGKTGTAQWGAKSKRQNLAWFSGFFPLNNPRYAFAVVYEGVPGESISGGRKAAPMVRDFFYKFQDEIKEAIKPPPKAMMIEEDEEEEFEIPVAIPVVTPEPEIPAVNPGDIPMAEPVISRDPSEIPAAVPVEE
ncbi:penicillin-binding transpeptidase domain-containing protein [Akkermansiaceae bacterium]|nr:penicillin-binding transpeptidase domain-containing protein [Akkermansiaceae bacterium]